jgi:hypothetical protein
MKSTESGEVELHGRYVPGHCLVEKHGAEGLDRLGATGVDCLPQFGLGGQSLA